MKQFDEHLTVSVLPTPSRDEMEIQIVAPGPGPGTRISVGSALQSASLSSRRLPVYPPLARSTRIQGAVVLDVGIGKDGSVVEAKLVSGHPLLARRPSRR